MELEEDRVISQDFFSVKDAFFCIQGIAEELHLTICAIFSNCAAEFAIQIIASRLVKNSVQALLFAYVAWRPMAPFGCKQLNSFYCFNCTPK